MSKIIDIKNTHAYLIGSGIASLASAAYLIKDGHVLGSNIHIFEESDQIGGSLDAHGKSENGYVMRGGRMFDEEAYTCTFDLLSFIPSLSNPEKTVRDEIFEFNQRIKSHSHCRLVANGQKVDVSSLGFSGRDRLDLIELMIHSEESLGTRQVDECFQPSFFKTNFWFMWCTTFAFQPWHSAVEFKLRFIQEFPRIETLAGVRRTPYNQYDSIVRPLVKWLREQSVNFEMNCQITDMDFKLTDTTKTVENIQVIRDGKREDIATSESDLVFITIGSMTADSSFGSMTAAPRLESRKSGGS